jgi:hypothetical protein
MAALVGAATGRPPAFVHSARVLDLGKGLLKVKGISSGRRHGDVRARGGEGRGKGGGEGGRTPRCAAR